MIAHAAGLGCAAGRFRLGIEVEDDTLSAEVRELDGAPMLVGQLEVGRLMCGLDHASILAFAAGYPVDCQERDVVRSICASRSVRSARLRRRSAGYERSARSLSAIARSALSPKSSLVFSCGNGTSGTGVPRCEQIRCHP